MQWQNTAVRAAHGGKEEAMTIHDRARAYLARMPVSVSGAGGHVAAFSAAMALVKGFALDEATALALLVEWNASCLPPWTEADLRHKLRSAASSSGKPSGYLLRDSDSPSRKSTGRPSYHEAPPGSDAERKAKLRGTWPTFHTLTEASIEDIARLRQLPVEGVWLAYLNGYLASATVDGHRCFVIREGTFAQARRFDGQPFTLSDGRHVKAKNLPGSQGAFLGRRWLGAPAMRVLLVEGAIALVEAAAAHEIANPPDGWTILAATSASSRFSRDPDLLGTLAGRKVRIVPDNDDAGLDAAASWLAELEGVGCAVDAVTLPTGCKDLGPLVADPNAHLETLKALLQ